MQLCESINIDLKSYYKREMSVIDYIIKELIEIYIINEGEKSQSITHEIKDQILKYITKAICDNADYFDYNEAKSNSDKVVEKNGYIEILKSPVAQEKIDRDFNITKNIFNHECIKKI